MARLPHSVLMLCSAPWVVLQEAFTGQKLST